MKYLVVFTVGLVTGVAVWVHQSRRAMKEYSEGVNNLWLAYNSTSEMGRLVDEINRLDEELKGHARNGW